MRKFRRLFLEVFQKKTRYSNKQVVNKAKV